MVVLGRLGAVGRRGLAQYISRPWGLLGQKIPPPHIEREIIHTAGQGLLLSQSNTIAF